MNDAAIKEWAAELVDPKLSLSQIIQNLLDNSQEDGMSEYDKKVCIRALQLIKRGELHDHSSQPLDRPHDSRLLAPDDDDGDEEIDFE